MTPYYDDGSVQIWHGDCEEILPTLARADIAITSPPYNVNCPTTKTGGRFASSTKWLAGHADGGLYGGYADHGDAMPMDEYEAWQRGVLAELWTHVHAVFYNHKPRPWNGELWLPLRLNPGLPLRQIVTWARPGGINFSTSHFVPTYEWILVFARRGWHLRDRGASGVGDVWTFPPDMNTGHPASFPLTLPARIIETTGATSVLDPFMGSGTTLRAAKDAGVRGIGIELSEAYCEIAAKRLAQEVLDFGDAS